MALISTEDKEDECLRFLKERIADNESLANFTPFFDDKFLLHFVRGRKCKPNSAFATLEKYMHLRKDKYREFFLELIPTQINIQEFSARPLKRLGPKGQLVIVSRPEWWPPPEVSSNRKDPFGDLIHKLILVAEEAWNYETVENNGLEFILEFTGYTWRHAKILLSVSNLIKGFSIFYKAMPLKYTKMHYLNPPFYFKMVHNVAKTIAPTKLVERVHVHEGDCKTLHTYLPPEILPDWMGGVLSDEEAFDATFHESILQKDEYYNSFNKILSKS